MRGNVSRNHKIHVKILSFPLVSFFLQLNDEDENYSLQIRSKPLGVTTSNTVR